MPFLTKIEQLNSADLTAYRPLILDGDPVGLIWRDNLARLRDHDLDLRDDGDRLVWHAPADFAARNAILADLAAALAREGYVSGWRNEQLPLLANLHRPVRALIERAAAPVIGVCGYGVHLNGTTMRDGVPHMWIARRAATKSVEPLARQARPVGIISYTAQTENGIRADTLYNYDLELPPDFRPHNRDGEVGAFHCLPLDEVARLVRDSDEFKQNSAVVVIDYLIRHGYLTPDDTPDYPALCRGIHRRHPQMQS